MPVWMIVLIVISLVATGWSLWKGRIRSPKSNSDSNVVAVSTPQDITMRDAA